MAVVLHITAGSLGLISGYVALFSTKGAPLHRRAGRFFFWVMLAMSLSALGITIARGVAPATNIPAAVLTAYLVVTGLTAVRPLPVGAGPVNAVGALVAFGVGLVSLGFGFEAVALGGTRKGMPAFPFFLFGFVGVLAGALDLRMIRSGGVRGAARVARHLWRMCFALLIAALSFFLGQSDRIPKSVRIPLLLALPILAVLVTMLYWVWRVGIRRKVRGFVGLEAPMPDPGGAKP